MFQVAVRRRVTAFHHLFGGDFGAENEHHSHDYLLEVVCQGTQLDGHGYLFNISVLEKQLDVVCDEFRGQSLNEKPGFEGKNPSVERFAEVIASRLKPSLMGQGPEAFTVVVWEHDLAWASFKVRLA
ncbi:MAG: 6-carboxytetrahydropterin synthase [Archangium sp.]|nr:6-carboxytetrahydropterin synthase [Archangium sp.]